MFKIALKDLKLFRSDKRGVLLTFLLPLSLITLFAFIFGGAGGGNKDSSPISLLISDLDKSDLSQKIITALDSEKSLHITRMNLDSAKELVTKGKENCVLVLHKGLSDSASSGNKLPIEFMFDGAKQIEVAITQQSVIGNIIPIIGTSGTEKKIISGFDAKNPGIDSVSRSFAHKMISEMFNGQNEKKENPSFIQMTPLVMEEENSLGLIHAVAGTAVMMLLFSIGNMGGGILSEKEDGTLKKLLYSPMHPNNILFGKMIAAIFVACAQLTAMFLYAHFVFGLEIGTNIPALAILILATAFAVSGFGIFLASFAKSRAQVQGLTTLIVLPMSAIGGSMFPTFAMPAFMQKISPFSLNYWSVNGFYDILWRHFPISEIAFLTKVGMLLLIGTVMLLIALRLFKRNVLKIA